MTTVFSNHEKKQIYTQETSLCFYMGKLLRRAGVSTADLVTYYSAVIRPTVEYACPAWHSSLTVKQSEDIERLQKRALRCIVCGVTYKEALSMFELSTLADRREELMRRFFDQLHETSRQLPRAPDASEA